MVFRLIFILAVVETIFVIYRHTDKLQIKKPIRIFSIPESVFIFFQISISNDLYGSLIFSESEPFIKNLNPEKFW